MTEAEKTEQDIGKTPTLVTSTTSANADGESTKGDEQTVHVSDADAPSDVDRPLPPSPPSPITSTRSLTDRRASRISVMSTTEQETPKTAERPSLTETPENEKQSSASPTIYSSVDSQVGDESSGRKEEERRVRSRAPSVSDSSASHRKRLSAVSPARGSVNRMSISESLQGMQDISLTGPSDHQGSTDEERKSSGMSPVRAPLPPPSLPPTPPPKDESWARPRADTQPIAQSIFSFFSTGSSTSQTQPNQDNQNKNANSNPKPSANSNENLLPPQKKPGRFAWLTRAATMKPDVRSVSQPAMSSTNNMRKDTVSSSHTDKQRRDSLRDQFQALRLQNEANAADDDGDSVIHTPADASQPAAADAEVSAPTGTISPVPEDAVPSPEPVTRKPSNSVTSANAASSASANSIANPNLAPGTVAGISTSASDAATPVDWELWQQVVNHGPASLKEGDNAEKLNAAIKLGIPQTIRGVIWQALADSRSAELEEVYYELLRRGTETDSNFYPASRQSSVMGNGHSSSPSSATTATNTSSSTHSEKPSSSLTTNDEESKFSLSNAIADGKDPETMMKAQAVMESIRKHKSKEDLADIQRLEKAIRRDMGSRTSYSRYFMSQKSQEGLFGVCKAYALYDDGVGYAQGMSFIVMPLLFNMDEGEAFTLLVKLMNQYGMREMYIQGMPGLHLRLYQFERLLEDLNPALACHLRRRHVSPLLYATQWFLTLFAYRFPLQLVLRIYDLIFEEGVESTILRFSVAIMSRNADKLLNMQDMSSLTTFLKEKVFDVYIDSQPSASSILESGFFGSSGGQDKEVYRADIMVQDACAIPLTSDMIKTYTEEWTEQTRIETEAAIELDTLKQRTIKQEMQIRKLEEHSETSDKEKVELATKLVRFQVDNESLSEKNEVLTMQVDELHHALERQAGSNDMSARQAIEEELVETKMEFAKLSQTHEELKQKWSDLRKALD